MGDKAWNRYGEEGVLDQLVSGGCRARVWGLERIVIDSQGPVLNLSIIMERRGYVDTRGDVDHRDQVVGICL